MQSNKETKKKRTLVAKIGRGFAILFLSILFLILIVLLLLQTAPVQNFARKKIVSFLEQKLDTKVAIGGLDITFPKMLVLEGVYIEDQTQDTLLAGRQLKVDIDLFKLLSNEIQINEINLDGITAKIKRQLPDTLFNYQFIIDAFASEQAKPANDTTGMKLAIEKIIIDDTRLVFFDVVTGNDADIYLKHFDTNIDIFDPDNLAFDVPNIRLNGVRGRIKQTTPLTIPVVNTNPNPSVAREKPQFLKFTNQQTALHDIDFAYSNEVSAVNTRFKFKDLKIFPSVIDLEKSLIAIRKVELNELDGMVTLNSKGDSEVIKLTTQNDQKIETTYLPWKITVGDIRLNNNHFVFDDNTKPRQSSGMDYAHLGIRNLTLHANKFLFNRDTIAANIFKGAMRERSGFVLNELNADLQYTNRASSAPPAPGGGASVRLSNLLLRTSGSEIRGRASVRYPSLEALKKDPAVAALSLDLDNSHILVKDILIFVPDLAKQPVFKNPEAVFYINSRINGSLALLHIDELQFSGFQNTRADLSGTLTNASDPKNIAADLNIRNLSTTRTDILLFAPPKSIPDNITIPDTLSVNGILKGGMANMYANISLNTTFGDASVNGTIANATNSNTATYSAEVSTHALDVGRIIQQSKTVGTVTADFIIEGKGFDPKKAVAGIDGVVYRAEYNKYTYRNIRLEGAIANQQFTAKGGMKDPNLHFAFKANGNLSGTHPGIQLTASIDSIKTRPLRLTEDAMIYRGEISANFPELNMDSLNGQIYITNSLLVANNQRVNLDSVQVIAVHENNLQSLVLKTDFVNANVNGQYKLTQLGDIFRNAIQPYYAISTDTTTTVTDPYNFTIAATIVDHPAIHAFLSDLTRMDDIALAAGFSSTDGWNANLTAPYISLGANTLIDLKMTANTEGDRLRVITNAGRISSGESLALVGTRLRADLVNDQIDFDLRIGDEANRDKYKLHGLLAKEPANLFAFSLRPDSLLLNYALWNINSDNLIRFGPTLVNAHNFDLSRGNQHLIINSPDTTANSPMEIRFADFRLATLTGFVQPDSLLADGTLNGNILLNDLTTQPNFTTDLTINNLAIKSDTIGDVNAKIDNTKSNIFATNVTITGRGNDVALTGNYYLKPQNNSNMDLNLAIRSLQLNTLEGASMGSFREGKGFLSGNVKVGGTVKTPDIDGRLSFNETSLIISMLNNEIKIDNEQIIAVDNTGLRFNSFTVRDSAENRLTINGVALTTNYLTYKFDLNVRARNFRALNSTKKDNGLYYGQLYFDTNLKLTGTEAAPVVDGNLRINEDTKLTIVLPQSKPGVVEREGIVVFVDKDAPVNDALFLAAMDTLNKTSILGMELSANIEIDRKAELNLVIDEGNGDFLSLKGEAVLTGGIDKSGKITLTGSYELDAGAYEMSFNFLRRRFDIQRGSKITWIGEPTNATLDITAVYIANTSATELVQDQITAARTDLRYRQRLPFEVLLNMDGPLMQPILTFDIRLPEESTVRIDNEIAGQVELRLNQLKAEPSELNKQVFALLLLNRFVSENPFESAGGVINAGSLARQSVSKLLTEQLNNLAGDLIAGVDINFDVVSSEDYTSGSLQNKTDLNVGLSKRLLNDRLNVSIGTNFELEGGRQTNQTGTGGSSTSPNLNVEYALTQDGRYLIRAYRRNEYEGVVEGYVVETGVSFIMSVDYNLFKEVFENRKKRQEANRERRRMERSNIPPEKPANAPVDRKLAPIDNTRKEDDEN